MRQMSSLGKEILEVLGIKRGCIIFGRRVRSLKKYLRELLERQDKKIRESKALFGLKMATSVKDNKKCFYKYINGKRKGKVQPLFFIG